MMQGRCQNCRHWQEGYQMTQHEIEIPDGWQVCTLADLECAGQTLALALDRYALEEPRLFTAPTFGCVQFEAIP
jgi:hypothetical protein